MGQNIKKKWVETEDQTGATFAPYTHTGLVCTWVTMNKIFTETLTGSQDSNHLPLIHSSVNVIRHFIETTLFLEQILIALIRALRKQLLHVVKIRNVAFTPISFTQMKLLQYS